MTYTLAVQGAADLVFIPSYASSVPGPRFVASREWSDAARVYLNALLLPASAVKEAIINTVVREYRWKRYVREHREFEQGAEAGRRLAR